MTVALLQGFVPHESSAWQFTLQELGRYYDRVLARPAGAPCPPPPRDSPALLAGQEPPAVVAEMVGNYRDIVAQLGVRVAELHLALASDTADPAFAPEPYSAMDLRSKYQSLRNLSGRVLRRLRERLSALPATAQREAASVLEREAQIVKYFEPLRRARGSAVRIRVHGNLDLRHAIYTGKDFVLTDFDGPETLTLAERRRKRSPLRDLAWMVRSFEFAACRMLLDPATVRESDVDTARPWALHWTSWVAASFVQAYLNATAGAPFVPLEPRSIAGMFDAFLLEAALYQLQTELEDRPESTMILLLGISNTLDRGH
jgi:maltose alpha-D-glucosyltransferase/alpha-amylase